MGDFTAEGENQVRLRPLKEHRVNMKRAMAALPELDPNPHDLVKMLFSEDERKWLRQNLRGT